MTATLGSYVLEALRLEDTTDPLESTLYCTECSIPDLLSKCRAPIEWIRVGGSDDVCFDDVSDSLLQQTKVYHAHSLRQAIEVVLTLKEVPATLILDIGPEVEGNDVMVAQTLALARQAGALTLLVHCRNAPELVHKWFDRVVSEP